MIQRPEDSYNTFKNNLIFEVLMNRIPDKYSKISNFEVTITGRDKYFLAFYRKSNSQTQVSVSYKFVMLKMKL